MRFHLAFRPQAPVEVRKVALNCCPRGTVRNWTLWKCQDGRWKPSLHTWLDTECVSGAPPGDDCRVASGAAISASIEVGTWNAMQQYPTSMSLARLCCRRGTGGVADGGVAC